jgi:hypothetical protein
MGGLFISQRCIQELIPSMAGDPKLLEGKTGAVENDPLLTPEQVAKRLNTSLDWVWDHSSRKTPFLPVIRFGNGPGRAGILRYRASKIEEFIAEQERLSTMRRRNSGRKIA